MAVFEKTEANFPCRVNNIGKDVIFRGGYSCISPSKKGGIKTVEGRINIGKVKVKKRHLNFFNKNELCPFGDDLYVDIEQASEVTCSSPEFQCSYKLFIPLYFLENV